MTSAWPRRAGYMCCRLPAFIATTTANAARWPFTTRCTAVFTTTILWTGWRFTITMARWMETGWPGRFTPWTATFVSFEIGRAHGRTAVTWPSRLPSSAWKNKQLYDEEDVGAMGYDT